MRYIEKNSHVGKKKVFENQRLVARKTYGLSRRQQRFKSAWGRQQETEGASLYPENQVFVVRLLYYKHPALVKPSLPALKPLRSLQPRHVLRPSGKNSPLRPKTPSPSCSRRNLRHEDNAFIRQAYGLRAALFFPAHRMYAPPLAAPKGPSARFESAS